MLQVLKQLIVNRFLAQYLTQGKDNIQKIRFGANQTTNPNNQELKIHFNGELNVAYTNPEITVREFLELYAETELQYPNDAYIIEKSYLIRYSTGERLNHNHTFGYIGLKNDEQLMIYIVKNETFAGFNGTIKFGEEQDGLPDHEVAPNIGVIRELLTAAFSAESLRSFCLDRPLFQPVYHQTTRSMGKDDVVNRLIEYCNEQVLFNELLSEVQIANSRQYAVFEPRLR